MKGFKIGFLIFMLMVSLFIIISGCDSRHGKEEQTYRIASVQTAKVKIGDISSYISVTGTLAPNRESRIGPKIEGRIEKIFFDEGDRVQKGASLFKLEQINYSIAKKEAIASFNTAQAQLEKTKLALNNITKDYKRISRLWKEKVISEQHYDKIETEYTTSKAELKLAKARLKETEANMAMAKQNFKDTITYAPFSGFIVKKLMEEGEVSSWVSYKWEVLHLVDISKVKIECPIAETKISFLYTGKRVTIEVDAYPDDIFSGEITTINPQVDPHSRTAIIKIEIPNEDSKLRPGMFARLKIAKKERKGVLQIPKEALLVKGEKHMVFKVEDHTAKVQEVQLGISDGRWVEVVEGLKEEELVVVDGLYALKEGTKVKIYQ